MFAYNKPCETKDGKVVVPLLKEGDKIVCLDGTNTVYYKKEDFITKKEKKTKVKEAIPLEKEVEIKEEEPAAIMVKDEAVVEKVSIPLVEEKKENIQTLQTPKISVKNSTVEEQIIKRKDNTRGEYI